MKTQTFPVRDEIRLESVLYALSDPVRLAIVRCIAQSGGERACVTFGLPIPKSTLAHHFKVLRATGVLATRLEGTQSLNSLRRADLNARFPGLLDAVLCAPADPPPWCVNANEPPLVPADGSVETSNAVTTFCAGDDE